jgi:hypothetical protein
MRTFNHHDRKHELNERGINMVDLMMWLVIAALLLAAALQAIGYYQRAAFVYQMSTDVDSVATTAIALAAIESRTVGSADLQSAIAQTKLQPGVTITWGTVPVFASSDNGDSGFDLVSAVTPLASVPGAAASGTVYAVKATHKNVSQKEVVYVFESTASYKVGASILPKDSFTLNPYNDAPIGGGGSGGSVTGDGTSVGTPVVSKVLGQKVTVSWGAVSGASGYVVTAGTVTQNVTGGSTTRATLTLPTGFTGTATVKSIVSGVTSAASAPVSVAVAVNEYTTSGYTTDFKQAEITGNTGTVDDLVSAPKDTSMLSSNGRYMVTFRTDGNFALYDLTTGNLVKSTQTATPRAALRISFQPDGNLVAYDDRKEEGNPYAAAIKATGTWNVTAPAKLKLEDDGSLKIRDSAGVVKYDSSTTNGFMIAP